MFNEQYLKANGMDYCHKCKAKLSIDDFLRCGISLKGKTKLIFEFKCNNKKCDSVGRWNLLVDDVTRFELLNLLSAMFIDEVKDDIIPLEMPTNKSVADLLAEDDIEPMH